LVLLEIVGNDTPPIIFGDLESLDFGKKLLGTLEML
jgi:hypothetical protein